MIVTTLEDRQRSLDQSPIRVYTRRRGRLRNVTKPFACKSNAQHTDAMSLPCTAFRADMFQLLRDLYGLMVAQYPCSFYTAGGT